ncbi:MAG: urea ABC transporter substrate-binding protein [Planctomycetota bacterium]|nr:urea ABC transporter substrate-binding protein [Planctomycetota bacterium]
MNRSHFFAIVILLCVAHAGSAFEDENSRVTGRTSRVSVQASSDSEPAVTPIRVGILHSQSGTMAVSEQSLIDAALMAIDEVNERGGVLGRPLQPVIEDGASDGPTFAEKARKLITEDKVSSVFGCWTSASRKAVLPIVEEHNHLLWYPVQYEGRESSRNIIYTGATPNQQILPAVDWCRREFGTRMFLVGSDYVFPRTANEIIKLRMAEFGATPVGEEYRPLGSQDFDELIARIIESKPDVVLNTINGDSNRAFFAALNAAGMDARQIPVMSFSIAEHELRNIGLDLTIGHYASWTYFQSIDTPANRRFVREFRKRYGAERVTDDPIEAAYSQIHMFAKAVDKAGSTDIDAIRHSARGLIYAAPGGLIRVDPRNLHTWKVPHVGRIQTDGQFRILWSNEDPLPPQPYLAATFLSRADTAGSTMFSSISTLIDITTTKEGDSEPQLFLAMANVRGFLGNVRTEFRHAALSVQPGNRLTFENAWREFESHWETLREKEDMLTEQQRPAFEQFRKAYGIYQENAARMFKALYLVEPTDDAPDPREVAP